MMVLIRCWGLVLLLLPVLLHARQENAQQIVLLTDAKKQYRVDGSVTVFIDSTNALQIQDITSPIVLTKFKPSGGNLKFGYARNNIWLQLKAKVFDPKQSWVIEIPAPYLEYVDFYQAIGHEWNHYASGYYRPYSTKVVPHTGHVFPLKLDSDPVGTVFIQISGLSPKTFPLLVHERESFYEKARFEDFGYGVFFGILAVMFFYNLIIYFKLKQVNYLLYICTIVCTFFVFASVSGYAGKMLWPENPEYNFYAGRMSLPILTVVLSVFTIRFLEVRRYAKVMYYFLLAIFPMSVLAAILMATGVLPSAGNNLISVCTVIYLTTGIVCRLKGNKNANYFIAAWTVYLTGGLLLTLRNSGLFSFNFWTTHFVEIGAALETVLIAFALADQYRAMKQAKEDAQALALRVQQEANEHLECKVAERTEQLSKANLALSETLETVQRQTRVIENKNAELDGFFYRVSHDLKGPIATLQGLYHLAQLEIKDQEALILMERKNQQVQRLNSIISGLVNLTKLHDTNLIRERIDFEKLIADCLTSFSGMEKLKHITVRSEIQSKIEFYSEWTLLNAIVQNLIENAIKYSADNAPFIHIGVHQLGTELIISVKDNGRGIPTEHQSKIFDMFYRATNNINGSGLGLYILKRSVDKLKGTVDVNSKEGAGSVFTVRLPVS